MTPIDYPRRALLSVFDKTGIVELGRALHDLGWEMISSGGTARVLAEAGMAVTDVGEYTGMPAMLGHRVVTLHPRIHAGILADRGNAGHLADLDAHGIEPIDLVVVNLYPFATEPGIEMIDIGGPTLIRGAAKNHAHVGVVVDPHEYETVVAEIATRGGDLSRLTRRRLARAAFAHTAAYDAAVVEWFDSADAGTPADPGRTGPADSADAAGDLSNLPERAEPDAADIHGTVGVVGRGEAGVDHIWPGTVHLTLERAEVLRYGENPHQAAARYRRVDEPGLWDRTIHHSGPPLSYLNIFDADTARRIAHDLGTRPSAVVVKHANPCGVAVADDLATALEQAYGCDPLSAFGGVVATNRVIDSETAAVMEDAPQADVIIAPGYEDGVIGRLAARRRNTRILQCEPAPTADRTELRRISGGFLAQQPQRFVSALSSWTVVTRRRPTAGETDDAAFAWRVCAHTKSNAVVLAHNRVAYGIGAGQQNRVAAGELAARKAAGRAAGGACASDAFYPFADGIHAAADAGVAVIVQPGGSVNDETTIAAADERGVAMLFTGERQFSH